MSSPPSRCRLRFRPRVTVAAENLFLRKQLSLFVERKVTPRRATDAIRFTLARLSRLLDWRNALTIVKPQTLIRWHRKGFRLFWKWKSQPRGRPRVPYELRKLIVEMAMSNPTWGEERIADRSPNLTIPNLANDFWRFQGRTARQTLSISCGWRIPQAP